MAGPPISHLTNTIKYDTIKAIRKGDKMEKFTQEELEDMKEMFENDLGEFLNTFDHKDMPTEKLAELYLELEQAYWNFSNALDMVEYKKG